MANAIQALEQQAQANGHETQEQTIARLLKENALLKSRKATSGGVKISEKGAVSVYGMGRFPVTLYASQWEALAEKMPEILAFISANRPSLKVKE